MTEMKATGDNSLPYVYKNNRLIVVFLLLLCYTVCMKKDNLKHARTCVYNINYHIVWLVKYRRKVITPEIEDYMRTLINDIAADKGFEVAEFESGEGDHVHLFVSAPPKMSPSLLVQYLKGITGRKLFDKYPDLRGKLWKGELWNHSYYVETIGDISADTIRKYIEHQSKQY